MPVLSIRRALALTLLFGALSIGVLIYSAYFGSQLLSGVRAYVGGEGLWSKAEKDAAFYLSNYVLTGSEADYRNAVAALAVPLGDRQARLELEKPRPDLAVAYRGFLFGRNHPDDVPTLAWLFRRLRRVSYMSRAIGIWAQGDLRIEELSDLGREIHAAALAGALTHDRQAAFLARIADVNHRLTLLEDEFSYTLGEGARRIADGLVILLFALGGLLLAGGSLTAVRAARLLRREEKQIEYLAYHDPLTDLPNRSLFLDRVAQAVAQAERRGTGLAVLFVDLDRFKRVNDNLGHRAGDLLLKGVAERLQAAVREEDTVARLGGDEFTLLVAQTERPADAAKLAQKLLARIADPFDLGGRRLHVTTCIGVSLYPLDGGDAESLLSSADIAMYRAKELGRNGYQLCTPALNARASARLGLEADLRAAVESRQLELFYQPLVAMASGRTVGMEALVRWRHPREGLLEPDRFIPLAEESRLVIPIGDWALAAACRQAQRWRRGLLPELAVAVNLAAPHFQETGLARAVETLLRDLDLEPRCLTLEITESAALRNLGRTIAVLHDLRRLGVKVAMDDFGAGQTSLRALKRLPLDSLKIDRELVRDVATRRPDGAIVTSVIEMAHGLGLRVVAEGVESDDQFQFLAARGCDVCQGFLVGEALPAAEIEAQIEAGAWPRAWAHA